MSELLNNVVEEFSNLPGVGRRTALRLSMHLLRRSEAEVEQFVDAVSRFRSQIRYCKNCNNLSDDELCPVCSDPRRDRTTLCVVEQVGDVMSIESTGSYKGLYHVLGGALSPIDNVTADDLTFSALVDRVKGGEVCEIIIATNPTPGGDTTATYLARILEPYNVKVSRLAYGIPVGGDIEYADEITLYRAMEGRRYY